jgi:hypothetical protein
VLVNVNILTLFCSCILYFNIFSKYSWLLIIINYRNLKIKPKKMVFQNPYMHQYYIYSNLKIEFRPYGIEIKKHVQQVQKHHKCSSPSKSSFNFSHELFLLIKTTQFFMITQLKTPIILFNFLPWTSIQIVFYLFLIAINLMLPTLSYNDIFFSPLCPMVTLHLCPFYAIVIVQFCP